MSRINLFIEHITESLKNYQRKTEHSDELRRSFIDLGGVICNDLCRSLKDTPMTDLETCAVYDYFLSFNYGFNFDGIWLKTQSSIINLNQVVRFTRELIPYCKVYQISAVLTSTKRYSDKDQSWTESESVRITDIDLPYAVAMKAFERLMTLLDKTDK